MREIDQAIIDQMVSIGFRHHCTDNDSAASIYEYKYRPAYLKGNHYHLVVYVYHKESLASEHHLCIYDQDGRNVGIVYQHPTRSEWQRNALTDHISDIFKSELRMATLKNIIND